MRKILETSIDFVHSDSSIVVYTARQSYITQIEKWKKQYPDSVHVIHKNDDGSLCVRIPSAWFRFPKPPKKYKGENDDGDI